jgi:TonB family protein
VLKLIKTSSKANLMFVIAVLVTMALTASSTPGAEESSWDQTLNALFSEADIVAAGCDSMPDGAHGEPDGDPTLCGTSTLDFQAFQQALRQSITRLAEAGNSITPVTDWNLEDDAVYTRSFKIPNGAFDLVFTESRVMVFDSSTVHGGGSLPVTPDAPGTETVHDPVLIRMVEPVYPELARRAAIEATVRLKVTVTVEGTVSGVQIVSCSAPDLDFEEAAESAVLQWKYKPGTLNGRPMEVSIDVKLEFTVH